MCSMKFRVAKVLFAQAWLVGLSAGVGHCWANTADSINLTGWNANVIYQSNYPNEVVQGFDAEGNGSYSWVEEGTYGGNVVYNGLPPDQIVNSALTDPCTGTNTQFQLQHYNGNNELKLGSPAVSGQTLTLSTPAGYDNLAILAASGNIGGDCTSTFTLTFSDGSTSRPITYDPYDWGGGTSQKVFAEGLVRSPSGTEPASSPQSISSASYNMYETDIDLTALTSSDGALDSAKYIQSITFAEPSSGRIGVFAVSGVQNTSAADPLPEPSTVSLMAVAAVPLLLRRPAERWARRCHKATG